MVFGGYFQSVFGSLEIRRLVFNYYNKLSRIASNWVPPLLVILAILGVWEVSVRIFDIEMWLLPPPSAIIQTTVEISGMLSKHTLVTLGEVIVGFSLALVVGISLGVGISLSRTLERAIYPLVIASPTIPWLVIAPVLIIWFGHGLLPKVIVVSLIAFFPIVVNTVDGLRSVALDLVNLMRTLGASRWQIFLKVQAPSAVPSLFSGIKIAITVSVIGAVVGEWIGSSQGLGYLMIRSKAQFLTDRVFASILILTMMGVGLFILAGFVERLCIPWWHAQQRHGAVDQER